MAWTIITVMASVWCRWQWTLRCVNSVRGIGGNLPCDPRSRRSWTGEGLGTSHLQLRIEHGNFETEYVCTCYQISRIHYVQALVYLLEIMVVIWVDTMYMFPGSMMVRLWVLASISGTYYLHLCSKHHFHHGCYQNWHVVCLHFWEVDASIRLARTPNTYLCRSSPAYFNDYLVPICLS